MKLTVKDLVTRWKCRESTVRSWARLKSIPAIKLPGGDWRFDLDKIEKFEQRNTTGAR